MVQEKDRGKEDRKIIDEYIDIAISRAIERVNPERFLKDEKELKTAIRNKKHERDID